jgi:nicotinate-nucleotide--dimethylbenzimidazole phosphoribosyltransferase
VTDTPDEFEAYVEGIDRPDDAARTEGARLAAEAGSGGGRLGELAAWLAGVQGRAPAVAPRRARLVVIGDRPVGRSASLAQALDVEVVVTDRRTEPEPDVLAEVRAGAALADAAVDAGVDLLLLALPDPALAVPAAALVGLLTRSDAAEVTATGQPDAAWMVAAAATRDAMRRGRGLLADQEAMLRAVGGPGLAAAVGLLLQAAVRRTPVVLDGPVSAAAALVAARIAFRAPLWWLAGSLSPDPAHALALERLSLDPVLDLGLRGDDGTGALLAVPLLRAAVTPVA